MKKLFTLLIGLNFIGCSNPSELSNPTIETDEELKKTSISQNQEITKNFHSLRSLKKESIKSDSLVINDPYGTIKRIFETYNEFQESTDSKENLDSLKQALKLLETSKIDEETLTLVINVWMYYTVTDFKTLDYTENVLRAHKEQSITAIQNRIENKREWENDNSAPFSELPDLLEGLKND